MARVRDAARRRHPVIVGAWFLAATAVAAGSVMRIAARYWIGDDLRLLGVSFIAAGVAIAAVAWLTERIIGIQPPPS